MYLTNNKTKVKMRKIKIIFNAIATTNYGPKRLNFMIEDKKIIY